MIHPALALLRKDALSERRGRTALNASLLFAGTALVAVAFSLGAVPVAGKVQAALLWVILFFAATAGLSRSFVAEEESGTAAALRLSGPASSVLLGKLLANLLLMALIEAVVIPLFVLLLRPPIGNWPAFGAVLLIGTLALAAGSTLAAALVAKARGRGELYAVIAFPLLMPGLAGSITGTHACLEGAAFGPGGPLRLLVAYAGILLTVGFLVFEVLWEE